MKTEKRLVEQHMSSFFDHPDNVQIGKGRIIWAPSCGYGHPEGWVLLGGRRTTDIAEASAQAMWIDQVSK